MKSKGRTTRHFWTYQTHDQQLLINMARLGQCNREIMRLLGYTDCQITYALHKAKELSGMDQGFRRRWVCGNDPIVLMVLKDYAAVMAKDIERDIVPRIVHSNPPRPPKIK